MNFAIIGATGNVGRKTIEVLEKSKIKVSNLYLVASKNSAGKKLKFNNKDIVVEQLEKYDFIYFDHLLFCRIYFDNHHYFNSIIYLLHHITFDIKSFHSK